MSYCFVNLLKKALTIIVINSFITNSIFSINIFCINKEALQQIKNKNGEVNENELKDIRNKLHDVYLNINKKEDTICWCSCENAPIEKHFDLAIEIIKTACKEYDPKKKLVITNFAEEGCLDPYIIIAGLLGAEFSQITCNLIGKNNNLIKKCESLTKELKKYLGENFEITKPSDNIFEIKDTSRLC